MAGIFRVETPSGFLARAALKAIKEDQQQAAA